MSEQNNSPYTDIFSLWRCCLLMLAFSRLHSLDTPQSAWLLRTSDQIVAETSTGRHSTITAKKHPCLRRDSNPESQQAGGRRPTPKTTWPLGPATTVHIPYL